MNPTHSGGADCEALRRGELTVIGAGSAPRAMPRSSARPIWTADRALRVQADRR